MLWHGYTTVITTCNINQVEISYITICDIPSRYYIYKLFGLMVIFGPLVLYLFGCLVFIYSAVRFRHNGPTQVTHLFKIG